MLRVDVLASIVVLVSVVLSPRAEALCPGTIAPCDLGFPGDFDEDGDVDGDDFEEFADCATGPDRGPVAVGCEAADFDGDGDADHTDFGLWQLELTGACDCPPLIQEPPNGQPSGPMHGVHLFSGEYYITSIDHRIQGRGFDFVWARKYRSRIGPDTGMGNGWDFSYNIRIERVGRHLRLYDGNTRRDVYRDQGNGTWARHEFFRTFSETAPDTFQLLFADRTTWNFLPLDGAPAAGKIASIVDRHENTMRFEYDALGRLSTIYDTLHTSTNPRAITIAYNADGLIESVTDFTGRQFTYAYHDGSSSGGSTPGSPGDLKSATSPIVAATPTENDFPLGKTTSYTYSTGFADDRLNHNLLTITDPKGQLRLINTYSSTTDPNAPDFDRIIRQAIGDPQDVIHLATTPLAPGPANNNAVIEAIVNDRAGNVSHWAYDKSHRLARARKYTGRANPDQPTTATANRPQNKLRATDPDFFETRFQYNPDSLVRSISLPNGNEHQFTYDETNPDPRSRGNLFQACTLPGPLGGDQKQICQSFEYDPLINFDTNFVTRHLDARGRPTNFQYDASGNRTTTTHRIPSIVETFEYNVHGQLTAHIHPDNGSGHQRRDEFTYYDSGPSEGYLHESTVDVGARGAAFNLTTTYEYDAVGNVIRLVDPRGKGTLYTYNALDQIIQIMSRPVILPAGTIRYTTNLYYDANDNLARVCRQNIDEQGNLHPSNAYITRIMEYDALDNLVRTCEESGSFNVINIPPQLTCSGLPASEFITTEYEYDDNENPSLIRFGEGVEGRQPTNQVVRLYDERDLLFRDTWAPTDPGQSTTQRDYDANGNMTITYTGLESPEPRVNSFTYDGYDRMTSIVDPMGNLTQFSYDPSSNTTRRLTKGELIDTVPSSSGNIRLEEIAFIYDHMDRPIETRTQFFDADTQLSITDGTSNTIMLYSDSSHLLSFEDDNAHTTTFTYDTANRRHVVTDAKGHTATYNYDANSNLSAVTEVDKSDLGNPDETFITLYHYDALDRIIRSIDNAGNVDQQAYDSRGNLTRTVDALGNVVRYTYDSVDRLVGTESDLTSTGDGSGTLIGTMTTAQSWDDSHRLVTETDDNGHTTTHVYDALDREITTAYADCTTDQSVYDVHGNEIQSIDANGTIGTYTYDLLDRRIASSYTPGTGVASDTTSEAFVYDGLSRLRSAEDNDSRITFQYDSMGNVLSQNQDGFVTAGTYDGVGNKIKCTYPGGREVVYVYDALNRIRLTEDGLGNAHGVYDYIGPHRMERMDYENNTAVRYTYDNLRRMVGSEHLVVGGATFDERTYGWDGRDNKTQRVDSTPGRLLTTHDYKYDSLYRLTETEVSSPPPINTIRHTDYIEDDVFNRIEIFDISQLEIYSRNPALCEPGDYQMNQYSMIDAENRLYDTNGNLTTRIQGSPQQIYQYDVHNQLVSHTDQTTGITTAFTYDVFGRRLSKTVQGSAPAQTTNYLYGDDPDALCSLWQVLEERDGTGALMRHYTHGRDDVVHMHAGGNNYFLHHDDLGNVMALTSAAAGLVERYDYGDYGEPQFFSATGSPIPGSLVGNTFLFSGRRYDSETGLYYFRQRYLDPEAGRFISRDPLGIWGDPANAGNAYAYTGNNPWSYVDPMGTARSSKPKEIVVVGSKVKEVVKEAGLRSDGELVQAVSDAPANPPITQAGYVWMIDGNSAGAGVSQGLQLFAANIGTHSSSYDCWLCEQCGGTGHDPNCDDACNRCSIVAATPGGSSDGPMPQTREHILLARQVGVPAMNIRPLQDRVLVKRTKEGVANSYVHQLPVRLMSFHPEGTPVRALPQPILDDRRYRDLLNAAAIGPVVAAGPGPYPTAANPMAFSAGSLKAVRGGMATASAAGALKTIASAQTDYNFYHAWPAKWSGPSAKAGMRKKTAKKAAKWSAFDHVGNYNFKVEIEGVTQGALSRKRPGRVKYGDITLKRGY